MADFRLRFGVADGFQADEVEALRYAVLGPCSARGVRHGLGFTCLRMYT